MNADWGKNLPRRHGDTEETKTFETQRNGGSGGNRRTKAYRGSARMNADWEKEKPTPELIVETVRARWRMSAQVFQRKLPDAA
jgi:hypothetical protein